MHIALETKNEDILLTALLKQEQWAQQELYEEQFGRMMGICMRYTGNKDAARDLVHDGFIKVLKKIGKYQAGTSMNAWISRIVVNNCIDSYRRKTIRRTEDIDHAYEVDAGGETAVQRCTEKEIMAIVQQLPDTYRMIFNLYAIEGYSHKDIADRIGISESTSRSNLSKARAKLRALVTQKFGDRNG